MLFFKRSVSAVIFLTIVLSIPVRVFGQSLSDMSTEEFEKKFTGYEVKSRTDPFSGGTTAVEDLSVEELQLTGIVYRDKDNAYALISGYLVRPGDRIAGYRVDLIEREKVRLRRIDDVFVLVLGGGL